MNFGEIHDHSKFLKKYGLKVLGQFAKEIYAKGGGGAHQSCYENKDLLIQMLSYLMSSHNITEQTAKLRLDTLKSSKPARAKKSSKSRK